MTLVLAVVAVAIVAGGVVAVSARDARVALVGLVAALVVAPVLADPIPPPLPLAARIVAAVLAGELVWIVVRGGTAGTRGTVLGWPTELLIAAAAFVAGWAAGAAGAADVAADVGAAADASGPAAALAAGVALAALAVSPVLLARDAFRLGVGVILLVTGALLVRVGLAGTPAALEQLATGVAVVGLGAAVAALCRFAIVAGGSLEVTPRR